MNDEIRNNYKQILYNYICSLGSDIKENDQLMRISFSSISKPAKAMRRLVWIEKTDKITDFWVWVRKERRDKEYPNKNVSKFNPYGGWGGIPAFKILTNVDLTIAKDMVKYAYDNL